MPSSLANIFLLLTAAAVSLAQDRAIDTSASSITIHAGKAGLFSAAAHEHWVDAPIASGVVNESASPHAEFTVEARKMTVRPDSKLSNKDTAAVQDAMQRKVLDSERYLEIRFQSTEARKTGENAWKVSGMLTLHGVSKLVSAVVNKEGPAYKGRTVIKQTDFGIQPVTVAGGVIKVKNELDIQFVVHLASH